MRGESRQPGRGAAATEGAHVFTAYALHYGAYGVQSGSAGASIRVPPEKSGDSTMFSIYGWSGATSRECAGKIARVGGEGDVHPPFRR